MTAEQWPEGALFHSPLGLFPFQEESIARDYLDTVDGGAKLVVWDTGCIQGDADLVVNRGGNARHYRLADLVRMFNGDKTSTGHRWDPSIPTMVQREVDGEIRLGQVLRAWESGVKQTYLVSTLGGLTIRATADHPFLTERGWLRLDQLVPGDLLHTRGVQAAGQPRKRKPDYLQVSWLKAHPYASRRTVARSPHRVPRHRLVAEAESNLLPYPEFIARIKAGDVAGLDFLDPAVWAVHHKDHDHRNNDPSNLRVMTHSEHQRLHADEGRTHSVMWKVALDPLISVEPYGEEMTYDIEVADEPHNFVANGFVVHNCGKSIFAMRMAALHAEDGVDLTIVVCEKGKLGEWVADFAAFTALTARKHHGPNRLKQLDRLGLPQVLITTYETAKADLVTVVRPGQGKRGEHRLAGPLFEAIAPLSVTWHFDESGAKLGNRTSDLWKAYNWVLPKMAKAHPSTHRVYALTATPLERDWETSYNQCLLISPRHMPLVHEFENWFVSGRHPVYGTARYRTDQMPLFASMVAPLLDRRRKTDPAIMAQFPKKTERATHIEMAPDQAALYEMLEGLQDGQEEPVPGLWTLLRMAAGHPASIPLAARHGQSRVARILVEELGEEYFTGCSSAKERELLTRLETLVKAEGQKVVVFTFFGQTILPVLAASIRAKGITVHTNHGGMTEAEQTASRMAFRTDPSPCVFLTSDAGSRGINLPEATHVYEYESALTYANRTQRIDRIHRIDSGSPTVTCTTLVMDRTVEVSIINLMAARNEASDVLLGDEDAGEGFLTAEQRKEALQIARLSRSAHRRPRRAA